MRTIPLISPICSWLVMGCVLLFAGLAQAQSSGSVSAAFQVAKSAVNPELQTRVISAYGIGTPTAIQKWYFIFYDPTVHSHGRAVLVQNNQIVKSYAAAGGVTYSAQLTFDPSRITSEAPALQAAQGYADRHQISYDSVRALLKETSLTKPFRWKIDLYQKGSDRGYVLVNALDDSVANYVEPSASPAPASSSPDNSAEGFGQDVKKTFLGIGGDLQEFFTGERTVDK